MTKRKKIGDIYSFKFAKDKIIYFQYLGTDTYQLGGDCIAIFKLVSYDSKIASVEAILDSGLLFVKLTLINQGLKDQFYSKIYNSEVLIVNPEEVKFRSIINDYYEVSQNKFIKIMFSRNLNSSELNRYNTLSEYEELTQGTWEDGVMLAQGLKEKISAKLKDYEK